MQVELAGLQADDVPRRASLDDRLVRQRLSQLRDLALDLGHGRDRGGPRIEVVRQPVYRYDPVGIQEQDRKGRALLRPAQTDWALLPDDLERAEDAEVEHSARTVTRR